MPYGAALIIGRSLDGKGLESLASRLHVWVPEMPEYEAIAKASRDGSEPWGRRGITLYYFDPVETAEETFLSLLETIDLHHGEFSGNPRWEFLEVHGLEPTESVREALFAYSVDKIERTDAGFIARRYYLEQRSG